MSPLLVFAGFSCFFRFSAAFISVVVTVAVGEASTVVEEVGASEAAWLTLGDVPGSVTTTVEAETSCGGCGTW